MSFLIAPSLLSSDFSKLGEEIQALEKAGADWIHWDIMDSHFVPNLTFGPPVLKALRPLSSLFFDVHLMVEKPENLLLPFAKAGANSITFHLEACKNPLDLIIKIKTLNLKAGLSLKPDSPIDKALPFLENLDLILIMTVEPGEGGQTFLTEQAKKVKILREKINSNNYPTLIEVDGGITPETAKKVSQADVLVSGNYIFQSGDYNASILQLRNSV
ncbi:MAG: ribulose-phosphate 3-epimerase [Oligoflexia bacterium]|nr:ribulose-phosphate 3-epimerase [Oligoflexia bacterium]